MSNGRPECEGCIFEMQVFCCVEWMTPRAFHEATGHRFDKKGRRNRRRDWPCWPKSADDDDDRAGEA